MVPNDNRRDTSASVPIASILFCLGPSVFAAYKSEILQKRFVHFRSH